MAISDKILYLNDTKKLLKQEINKSTEITDEDTFRSYAPKIYDGYLDMLNNGTDTLWNNLEKVSASGETPVLENVETAPMKMVLSGNTIQETTSGNNLLDTNNISHTSTSTDLTINSNENGEITINGESYSANVTLKSSLSTPLSGTYTLIFKKISGNISNNEINFRYAIGNAGNGSAASTTGRLLTNIFNADSNIVVSTGNINDTMEKFHIYFNAGATFNNYKFVIYLVQGTYTSENIPDYEPYTGGQPSPSPEYPQEVKVVKGENVVSVQSKNLAYDLTYHSRTNQFYSLVVASYSVVNGEYYAISVDTPNTDKKCYINTTISSKLTRISGTTVQTLDGTRKTWIVQATETATATNIGIISRNSPTDEVETGYLSNFMIEHISNSSGTSTPYVPYSKTDYSINLGDIELCKINTYKDFPFKAINGNEYYDTLTDGQKNALNYGSWYVHKAIGKKVVTSSEILGQTDSYSNVIYYKFNKNTDSINYNNYNSMVAFYTHAKISNSFNFDSLSQVSTINSLAENIRYWVGFPKGTTLAQAKEKLVGSVLYYILKTPTEEEITNTTLIEQLEAISKAKSVKDKTYITQTNEELPFILDVEAIKEYEENLDNN